MENLNTIDSTVLSGQDNQVEQVDLINARKCFITGNNLSTADLGVCLFLEQRYKGKTNRLPDITMLPYYVSRVAFNDGIMAKESGKQSYIMRFPDGSIATHWLPLYLHDGPEAEHWIRTALPKTGTKRTKPKSKQTNPPTNYYLLLDHSGSMGGPFNKQCLTSINDIVTNTIENHDFVSLTTFNSVVKLCFPLLQKKQHLDKITGLINKQNNPDGMTSFYRALYDTIELTDTSRPVVMVALTDGEDNDSEKRLYYNRLMTKLEQIKKSNIRFKLLIITVGNLNNRSEIEKIIAAAPYSSELISATNSVHGIKEAYDKVKKLIVSKNGSADEDVLGTSDFLPSAFSLIVAGENGKFNESDIWRVCARLLNLCVVAFAKQEKVLDEKSLESYCDVHRTLVEMLKDAPVVLNSVRQNIEKFMDKSTPNNRQRELLPDIGEAIQLLSLVDDINWKQFGEIYMQEMFRRSAVRINFLSDTDSRTDEEKVKFYWPQYKVSMLLTIFNVYFVYEVVHRNDRTIKDACDFYHTNMKYIDFAEVKNFIGKIEYIRNIDSFKEAMDFLGLDSDDENILRLIYLGKTFMAEPTDPNKIEGNLLKPANNIRNTDVNINDVTHANDYSQFASLATQKTSAKLRSKKIKHVGWKIKLYNMDPDDIQKLKTICSGLTLKTELYTAIKFGGDQQQLSEISDRVEHQEVDGQIQGYYADSTAVVFDILIDGTVFKTVATNLSKGVLPQTVKDKATNGQMGPRIGIVPITCKCLGEVNF